ncbi:MAG: hypothetical protein A4S09_17565 [Proteobacteria bacterium SG_bin7]|nr:MAG: hypothetical protein A4S09_17565 [Proteobacteria bacterium SG_bin7]
MFHQIIFLTIFSILLFSFSPRQAHSCAAEDLPSKDVSFLPGESDGVFEVQTVENGQTTQIIEDDTGFLGIYHMVKNLAIDTASSDGKIWKQNFKDQIEFLEERLEKLSKKFAAGKDFTGHKDIKLALESLKQLLKNQSFAQAELGKRWVLVVQRINGTDLGISARKKKSTSDKFSEAIRLKTEDYIGVVSIRGCGREPANLRIDQRFASNSSDGDADKSK